MLNIFHCPDFYSFGMKLVHFIFFYHTICLELSQFQFELLQVNILGTLSKFIYDNKTSTTLMLNDIDAGDKNNQNCHQDLKLVIRIFCFQHLISDFARLLEINSK